MRRPILLLALVLAACGGGEPDEYVIIEDFLALARPAECRPLAEWAGWSATELRSVSDSTWLLLDEARREVAELDHDLEVRWSLQYPATGPGAVAKATSATLLGDTAVAIADQGSMRLVVLSRAGEPIRSLTLGFIPNSVEATAAGEVLITPMPMSEHPPTLLARYDGERVDYLDVPPRPYDDMVVQAFGNAALVEGLPDGSFVLVHQFLRPRGFAIGADGVVTRLRVPTPDATTASLDYVPTVPLTPDQYPHVLLPGLALSVDPLRSELFLLTRSGRDVGEIRQRAILRLDQRLGFIEAFTADIAASAMVYLPHRSTALLADGEDRLHSCQLPISHGSIAQAE